MKILLDAFPLLAPLSGVGYYTLRLLKSLKEEYAQDDFHYFYGRRFSKKILEAAPSFDAGIRTFLKKRLQKPYKLIQPIKETFFRLGSPLIKADLYHETNYVPLPYNGPTVVTVFDLSLLRHPETHPKDRVAYFEDYFLKRLPRANKIITISDFSKSELVNLCGVDSARVTTVYLGGLETSAPDENAVAAFKKLKKLPEKYFLYTGNLEPRKNLIMLLEAYAQALKKEKNLPLLLLAGNASWLSEEIYQTAKKLQLENQVFFPGYLPVNELSLYYAGATSFLFPSRYEGFGLPVLEAMGSGAPVICSNCSSLPEVAGSAAKLLDPNDSVAWTEALLEVAFDENLRKKMQAASLEQAALFSWRRCAKETHQVYEDLLRHA